jgi:hypothetical protein
MMMVQVVATDEKVKKKDGKNSLNTKIFCSYLVIMLILSIFKPYRTRENDHFRESFVQQLLENGTVIPGNLSAEKPDCGYESFDQKGRPTKTATRKGQDYHQTKQPVECSTHNLGKIQRALIKEDPNHVSLILMVWICFPRKRGGTKALQEIEEYKTVRVVVKERVQPDRTPA